FFSLIAAPVIFQTFGSLAERAPDMRPGWLAAGFNKNNATQLAGLAVGPLFAWYFLLEGGCGLLAVITAWTGRPARPQSFLHKLRFYVVATALATVIVGWPIANRVSHLREARYSPNLLLAEAARAEFSTWHLYSLALNLLTLALVAVAMALAAWLPTAVSPV